MSKKPIFIAEIKTQSPYGFKSDYSFAQLMHYAIEYGDWISVHTNPLWDGSMEAISFVRKFTDKPILAKGLHSRPRDIKETFERGASSCLTVDYIPNVISNDWYNDNFYNHRLLLEYSNINKVKKFLNSNNHRVWKEQKFVYNLRDLRTGFLKKKNELQDYLDLGLWTCQASGIKSIKDVHPGVDAFIVGQNLVDFCKEIHYSKKV